MLDFVFKNIIADKRFTKGFFEPFLMSAIKVLKLEGKKIELSLSLVSEEEIRGLNNEYRNKDKVTDVLSFPLEDKMLDKYGILPLGDIFICPSFAKKKAKEENISIERELAWLTVHGFLHLAGYDHEKSKKEADEMRKLEDKILNNLK